MAQGAPKRNSLSKSKAKSAASQKKQQKIAKGRKTFQPKGRRAIQDKLNEHGISRDINRKNEAAVAAKALSAGSTFFLGDVKIAGKKELMECSKTKAKHENKATKLSDRLKEQLKKMGTDL